MSCSLFTLEDMCIFQVTLEHNFCLNDQISFRFKLLKDNKHVFSIY